MTVRAPHPSLPHTMTMGKSEGEGTKKKGASPQQDVDWLIVPQPSRFTACGSDPATLKTHGHDLHDPR
jgi:hypothetical protein